MEIEFQLTQTDLIAFEQHLYNTSRAKHLSLILQLGVGFAVALTARSLAGLGPIKTVLVGGLCFGFSHMVSNYLRQKHLIAIGTRLYQAGRQRGGFGSCCLCLEKRHLCERSSDGKQLRRPWSEVNRIEATTHYLFIFFGPTQGYVIPNRAFETPGAAKEFAARTLAYWNEARS